VFKAPVRRFEPGVDQDDIGHGPLAMQHMFKTFSHVTPLRVSIGLL
jgi:hypothetical protein